VSEARTALTVIERAQVALNSTEHERNLLELAQASKAITAITNNAGREQCHGARVALKRVRVDIEKIGKAAREDATAFSKACIAEEKRLIGLIQPEEERLSKIQAEYDERIAAEKRAKAEAEAKRVAGIHARIESIRETVLHVAGLSSVEVAEQITAVEAIAIDEATFAEFQKQAEGAKASTLVRLRIAHAAAEKLEDERQRLADERAELARQRAAEEVRLAHERERLAEEQRQARKAAEAEAARQAEVLRRQREEQETENTRIRLKNEADAQAERNRIEAEQRRVEAQLEAQRLESARIEAERVEAARAESDRLAEEARRLSAQKAAHESVERQQLELRQAEEARLAAERAELERQQEALRLAQEAITKPTDPVEATAAEDVQPATTSARAEAPERPSDEEIIEVVTQAFFVSEDVAWEWIAGMDVEQRKAA
jgi:hypothetical protein